MRGGQPVRRLLAGLGCRHIEETRVFFASILDVSGEDSAHRTATLTTHHVAHATAARGDVVVSWNFKHLVNPRRERAFNWVNLSLGYGLISILTPMDIVRGSGDYDD